MFLVWRFTVSLTLLRRWRESLFRFANLILVRKSLLHRSEFCLWLESTIRKNKTHSRYLSVHQWHGKSTAPPPSYLTTNYHTSSNLTVRFLNALYRYAAKNLNIKIHNELSICDCSMFIFRIMSLSSYIPAHHHYTTVHWIQPTGPIISIIITHPVMRRRPSINQLQHFEMWKKTVHNIQFIRKLLLAAHRGNIAQMEMLFDGARFISCHSRNLKAEWLNAFSAYIRFLFWLDWHESSDWPEMGAHWWRSMGRNRCCCCNCTKSNAEKLILKQITTLLS